MVNNKSFLAMQLGTIKTETGEKEQYVFHAEGRLLREPTFFVRQGETPQTLRMAVIVGRNPWLMLGDEAVTEQEGNLRCNKDNPFITLDVYGSLAETYADVLKKGSKIVFSGRPKKTLRKDEDAEEETATVTVIAENLYPLECYASSGGDPRESVSHVTETSFYNGHQQTQNVATLVAGVVKEVSGLRTVGPNHRDCFSFRMEVPISALCMEAKVNGTYDESVDYGNYKVLSCAIWGKGALRADKIVKPGVSLVVSGPMNRRDGVRQSYVNLNCRSRNTVSVLKWATSEPVRGEEDLDCAAETESVNSLSVATTGDGMALDETAALPF